MVDARVLVLLEALELPIADIDHLGRVRRSSSGCLAFSGKEKVTSQEKEKKDPITLDA